MKIKNCPQEAWDYEFIVVQNKDEELVYYTHTTDGFYADKIASIINDGVVVHNVRIQGKRKEKKKEENPLKTYVFSGVWSYTCQAHSKEEAEKMFDDAEMEEFYFDFDYCNVDELED